MRPETLRAAAGRGLEWILAQQRADGSFCASAAGIGAYYKVPYALTLAGHLSQAHRLLDWVAAHHLSGNGDFRAAERKALGPAHAAWSAYANAWLVLGAHRAGRWDLSLPGVAYLRTLQLEAGGFFSLFIIQPPARIDAGNSLRRSD